MKNPNLEKVLTLYGNRCARCHRKATEVHEIIPRSRFGSKTMSKAFLIDNSIALCRECHDWAHRVGAKNSVDELIQCQLKANKYG